MFHRGLVFAVLAVIWIVLSGKLDLFHLSLGAICCGLVTMISGDLVFVDREKSSAALLREGFRLIFGYFPWLLWQVVLANIQVLSLALEPGRSTRLDPRIVRYRTSLSSDFARFVFANSITLTPGTITLEMLGDELYVHAINQEMADGIGGDMERRIAWIYGEEGS